MAEPTDRENEIDAEVARGLYKALNAQNPNIVKMILATLPKDLAESVRDRAEKYKDR